MSACLYSSVSVSERPNTCSIDSKKDDQIHVFMPNKIFRKILSSVLHFIHINAGDRRDDIVDYLEYLLEEPSEHWRSSIIQSKPFFLHFTSSKADMS